LIALSLQRVVRIVRFVSSLFVSIMLDSSRRKRESYHVGDLDYRLMKAAREILAEEGSSRLTMRLVASRLGVSANAAYRHFRSRAELLGYVAADAFNELSLIIQQKIRDVDIAAKPQVASQAYFNYAMGNPHLYQLMFGSELVTEKYPIEYRLAAGGLQSTFERCVACALDLDAAEPSVRQTALGSWVHVFSSCRIRRCRHGCGRTRHA
jgi:AcrR family transcriptional regulator